MLATWSAFYPDKLIDTTDAVPVSSNDLITVIFSIGGAPGTVVVENKTSDKRSTKEPVSISWS
jgi:hypothetical protein